ncbi:unnamed protein product [Ceratitis capitata]|uniref:(Mediterranean fruit fly) hypothetical protein n=1 Tax=Ceratitis capitata TaxID=7213 RepID=A0A811UJN6_CERCA|nr:unnamed protein product [Ceratitis capitata]
MSIEVNDYEVRFTGQEKHLTDITTLHIREKDPCNIFCVCEIAIQQFIGVAYITMSLVNHQTVIKHWNNVTGTLFIKETMAANKLGELRHCIDKMLPCDHPQANRLFNT